MFAQMDERSNAACKFEKNPFEHLRDILTGFYFDYCSLFVPNNPTSWSYYGKHRIVHSTRLKLNCTYFNTLTCYKKETKREKKKERIGSIHFYLR